LEFVELGVKSDEAVGFTVYSVNPIRLMLCGELLASQIVVETTLVINTKIDWILN